MMNTNKSIILGSIFSVMFCVVNTSYAKLPTIAFFVSNNTQQIGVKKAYERLVGKAQENLQDITIDVLQKNHIEQGRFENVLGTYEMAVDKNTTSDNTEIFYVSPLQDIPQNQIFSLATELAKTFQQESVAVFVPSTQDTIAHVVVKFTSHQPNISEAIELVHEKLPYYATAFSLHLNGKHAGFNKDQVTQIEWLGSQINISEIKNAFPEARISSENGQAYLVYQNGKIDEL